MAAKFLGLFFLVIGTAGISNVYSQKEFIHRSKRSYPVWSPFKIHQTSRERLHVPCRYKFDPFPCGTHIVHNPQYLRLGSIEDDSLENPFFRQSWSFENLPYVDPFESSEEDISANDDTIKKQMDSTEQKFFGLFRKSLSSSSVIPTESYAYSESNTPSTSSEGESSASDLHAFSRKLPIFMFSRQYNTDSQETGGIPITKFPQIIHRTPIERQFSSDMKKENEDLIDNINTFTTLEGSSKSGTTESSANGKDREYTSKFLTNISTKNEDTDGSFISKKDEKTDRLNLANSDSATSKVSKYFSDVTSSSNSIEITKHHVSTIIPNVRSASTVFQHPLSKDTSLNDQVRYSDGIQFTSVKESKLMPTGTQNSPLNSEAIHSISQSKNLEPELDISSTIKYGGTTSQSKLSTSFETQSIQEDLEKQSPAEDFTLPNKVTSFPFIGKAAKDGEKEIVSTKSSSSKHHFAQEAVTHDHIIEIPSIRRVRIAVTAVFLVIALTALTVLAVYIFRLRRREVQYDQLMLIS